MSTHFATLHTLDLDTGHAAGMGALGIHTIGDLLAFSPFRHARAVAAALEGSLRRHEVDVFLVARVHDLELDRVLDEPSTALRAVDTGLAPRLAALGLDSVGDLARYAPFDEAEDLVASYVDDYRDPDAPRLLVPQPRKFTRNSKSFVSFTKQRAVRGQDMTSEGGDPLLGNLFWFPDNQPPVLHLGHAVSFRQDWIFEGTHLGEPRGSVNLFMGQDTQVSVLDWRRAVTAVRTEDTTNAERLASTLFHQRAVDEVARATAEEHQFGATGSFGANAATSGSFVAAGALIGGVGGGATGSIVGLGVDALTGGATGGLGTIGGAVIGTAVGSMVGAAAGSLVTSGAMTLGFVASDARGAREVMGHSAQYITQTTAQNSSSIRSFWSNIVSQNLEEEQQTIRTDRVTNHNRIHALNALYFEVLNDYRVTVTPTEVRSLLFLPFRPISFDRVTLERYWWIIRTVLDDGDLVTKLDGTFTSLTPATGAGGPPVVLPLIGEVLTADVEVELNFDGSAMELLMRHALGLTERIADPIVAIFLTTVEALCREGISVDVTTTTGDVSLDRRRGPNTDPNFIGAYGTTSAIPVHTITGIRVHNDNVELTVPTPLGDVDLTRIVLEDIGARLSIRDRAGFATALPQIGTLEGRSTLSPRALTVSAQASATASWDVGDRLREQFRGVDRLRARQERAASEAATLEARIQHLVGFLNANSFTFTRLVLEGTERAQLTRALEGVRIGGIELSQVASTDPVGFAGEYVVLAVTCEDAEASAIGVDTSKLDERLARADRLALSDRKAVAEFFADTRQFIDAFIVASRGQGNGSSTERRLFTELLELRRLLGSSSPGLRQTAVFASIRDVRRTIRAGTRTDDVTSLVCEFNREVLAELNGSIGEIASDDDVALPSPAIFMEPVLSHAKGAELYDLRRNSHYELLPAPGIGDADPNVVRSRPVELTPTETTPVLELLRPPELALPTTLGAALAEAGRLDLAALISSNATSLTSTISTAADLATELARASTQLTGDAQEQALQAATDVAGRVAESLRIAAAAPPAGPAAPAAPPTPVPTPPPAATTSRDLAPRLREVDRIDTDPTLTPTQRTERKRTLGVPVVPDPQVATSISVQFLDDLGDPITGQYQASVEGFSQDPDDDLLLTGSVPLDVSDGILRIPGTFRITPGRGVQLEVDARFGSATVPGVVQFRVPATADLVLQCRLPVRTETVVETSVKRAVDGVVATSGVGTLFEEFMSSQVSLPFRLVELTGTDSAETSLDLKREYDASPSSTSEESGAPSQRTFRVTTPVGRWAITLFGA